jgi:hypothetical protein
MYTEKVMNVAREVNGPAYFAILFFFLKERRFLFFEKFKNFNNKHPNFYNYCVDLPVSNLLMYCNMGNKLCRVGPVKRDFRFYTYCTFSVIPFIAEGLKHWYQFGLVTTLCNLVLGMRTSNDSILKIA